MMIVEKRVVCDMYVAYVKDVLGKGTYIMTVKEFYKKLIKLLDEEGIVCGNPKPKENKIDG